jgi:hypothetical protein
MMMIISGCIDEEEDDLAEWVVHGERRHAGWQGGLDPSRPFVYISLFLVVSVTAYQLLCTYLCILTVRSGTSSVAVFLVVLVTAQQLHCSLLTFTC